MDINSLTPEELASIERQLAEKRANEREREIQERETLKDLQHEFVEKFFPKLMKAANIASRLNDDVFQGSFNILSLKKQVYRMSDDAFVRQQSHNIPSRDFSRVIVVGYNVVDGWDYDLASAGIEGVNKWLAGKMNDSNRELVDMIRDLLRPNRDGILKANRIIELYNRAVKIGDEELIRHVQTIQEAYIPKKTSTFVKGKFKDEKGQYVWLNLSMSK
jgi:hypothetical protein